MMEQTVSIERMEDAIDIFGSFDENIKLIEQELGETLFFLTAAASSLGLSIYDAMLSEKQALSLLGNYSLK